MTITANGFDHNISCVEFQDPYDTVDLLYGTAMIASARGGDGL
jgi:hypothetical protein